MLNSQKFLIFLFALNMMIGIAGEINNNLNISSSSTMTSVLGDTTSLNTVTSTNPSNKNIQVINNPVDQWKTATTFIGILISGMNPLSLNNMGYDTVIEGWVANMITLFRIMLTLIAGLEIYFIFINKKQV